MREIKARDIMECWNLKYPDNPCTLKDIESMLKYIAFFWKFTTNCSKIY